MKTIQYNEITDSEDVGISHQPLMLQPRSWKLRERGVGTELAWSAVDCYVRAFPPLCPTSEYLTFMI